jgi:transaldolase
MTQNARLTELSDQGVAVWLDDMSRDRLDSGSFAELIDTMSVVGVTTNPTIFAAAISGSKLYNEQLYDLQARKVEVEEAVRMITTADVRWACDVLAEVARGTGRDGRVSIEVDPRLAHDTDVTVAEARQLWWLVDRPNLFVKIPATEAGIPAITRCIADGISVNVTLIFSIERYKQVMDAYLNGLEQRGGDFDGLESVASFFVSRVDTEIDKHLEKAGADKDLFGKAGIANAQLAYQAYEEVIGSERWKALADKGAHVQRPLWASTGVKNPDYDDTMYISQLVAPDIVNTMPEKTMNAYADHGELGTPIQKQYDEARATMDAVVAAGVSMDDVFLTLEGEGVEKFEKSWEELLSSVRDELQRVS